MKLRLRIAASHRNHRHRAAHFWWGVGACAYTEPI